MAKAGRKMKSGKRTKTGRLSRAGISPIDRGTERTQAMRARFGDHYQTALVSIFRGRCRFEEA